MNEESLAHYMSSLDEGQIHNELLRYKLSVMKLVINRECRKWIVYQKKRRDLERRRIGNGWKTALDFINTKISEGRL